MKLGEKCKWIIYEKNTQKIVGFIQLISSNDQLINQGI